MFFVIVPCFSMSLVSNIWLAKKCMGAIQEAEFQVGTLWGACRMSSGGQQRHQPIFTYLYCAVSTVLFAFMAGAYPLYLMENSLKGPKE